MATICIYVSYGLRHFNLRGAICQGLNALVLFSWSCSFLWHSWGAPSLPPGDIRGGGRSPRVRLGLTNKITDFPFSCCFLAYSCYFTSYSNFFTEFLFPFLSSAYSSFIPLRFSHLFFPLFLLLFNSHFLFSFSLWFLLLTSYFGHLLLLILDFFLLYYSYSYTPLLTLRITAYFLFLFLLLYLHLLILLLTPFLLPYHRPNTPSFSSLSPLCYSRSSSLPFPIFACPGIGPSAPHQLK